MQVICLTCGTVFSKPLCHVKRNPHNLCSIKCTNVWQLTEALRLGRRVEKVCAICGKIFAIASCMSKRYSTCSTACYKKHKQRDNNPNWRGGVTARRGLTTTEYRTWRKAVFVRDDYTCQNCGKRGNGELHAHHVKLWADYVDLRFDVTNGMTLCKKCHQSKELHTRKDD